MSVHYKGTDHMSDLISDDYRMLQVITRFGIKLGFGDQSIDEVCEACNVDTATFLVVVNYTSDPAHAHIKEMAEEVNLADMMRYLALSHQYFVEFRLPSIRRKLIEAINCSESNQIGLLTLKFYDEYAQEVAKHMEYENTHVHPFVQSLLSGIKPNDMTFEQLISEHSDNHNSIAKSIAELKNIIIKYSPNDNNAQLLNDVLMDIHVTEEDLLNHCRMEDSIFAECVRNLEREVRMRSTTNDTAPCPNEQTTDNQDRDELSEREKEVLVHLVKGMSNKEVANSMFISVHTVMTHRRNISRKLSIHAVSGLTIYAIVNGLVKIEDIKI